MKIKILKVFSLVIVKVERKLICREDSIIILRDDTRANSQLKTSFMAERRRIKFVSGEKRRGERDQRGK